MRAMLSWSARPLCLARVAAHHRRTGRCGLWPGRSPAGSGSWPGTPFGTLASPRRGISPPRRP
jgi:hypothetical protein